MWPPPASPDDNWPVPHERAGVWIIDAGTVTGNHISGANVNLLIEGWGVPVKDQTGCNPDESLSGPLCGRLIRADHADGQVFGNEMSNPKPSGRDCPQAHNYAVNAAHAKGDYEHNDSDVEFPWHNSFTWDNTCVGSTTPNPFRLVRHY
jgi:hypothetical protein